MPFGWLLSGQRKGFGLFSSCYLLVAVPRQACGIFGVHTRVRAREFHAFYRGELNGRYDSPTRPDCVRCGADLAPLRLPGVWGAGAGCRACRSCSNSAGVRVSNRSHAAR